MHEVSQPPFIGDLNMKLEQAVKEIRAALEASGLISNQVIMDSLNIIENQPNHLSYIEPGKTYVVKINAELFSEDLLSYLGSEFDAIGSHVICITDGVEFVDPSACNREDSKAKAKAIVHGRMTCNLYPSAFSGEVIFSVITSEGVVYEGIVPKHFSEPNINLKRGGISGVFSWIKVRVLSSGDGVVTVSLPEGQGFTTLTISADQVNIL